MNYESVFLYPINSSTYQPINLCVLRGEFLYLSSYIILTYLIGIVNTICELKPSILSGLEWLLIFLDISINLWHNNLDSEDKHGTI